MFQTLRLSCSRRFGDVDSVTHGGGSLEPDIFLWRTFLLDRVLSCLFFSSVKPYQVWWMDLATAIADLIFVSTRAFVFLLI